MIDQRPPSEAASPPRGAELYLDLLQRCLTGSLDSEELKIVSPRGAVPRRAWEAVRRVLAVGRLDVVRHVPVQATVRAEGRDWPVSGQTMVGRRRLEILGRCIWRILEDAVPGDLLEAGTWRGGAAIYMRAALEAYGDQGRAVWVADSFQGVPPPDPGRYPADAGETFHEWSELAVPLAEVKANFARYGLLDDRVRFLEGWFKDTLPGAPVGDLALLRVDGDLYESTMDALRPLYGNVSDGGFVIVDDYGAVPACRQAVDDFRTEQGVAAPLREIDWTGVYWRKGERG